MFGEKRKAATNYYFCQLDLSTSDRSIEFFQLYRIVLRLIRQNCSKRVRKTALKKITVLSSHYFRVLFLIDYIRVWLQTNQGSCHGEKIDTSWIYALSEFEFDLLLSYLFSLVSSPTWFPRFQKPPADKFLYSLYFAGCCIDNVMRISVLIASVDMTFSTVNLGITTGNA